MTYVVHEMQDEDWGAVRSIYLEGIATGNATFETEAPDWEAWNANHLAACRFVAKAEPESEHGVVGWAALSPVSRRPAYSGVAELKELDETFSPC